MRFFEKHYFIILLIVVLSLIASGVFLTQYTRASGDQKWVRGKYGKYCYQSNDAPQSIKYVVSFNSYEECKASIKS